ncbi:MAG: tetratricopeptide repeat protein [Terriglobales bacterium]
MPVHIEPFEVVLPGGGAEGCGRGLARLLTSLLDRCRLPASAEAGVRGRVSATEGWHAEISTVVGAGPGSRRAFEAEFPLGHHLLCRMLEFTAATAGREEVPSPVLAVLEDYATAAPAALVACWQALGSEGEAARRAWQRAFELDPAMTAPRVALARQALQAGQAASAAGLLTGIAVRDAEAARDLGLELWTAGETAAAGALLQQAVTSDAEDAVALAALAAWLARHAGHEPTARDEALLLATQATQRASDDYRTWAARADVHRAAADYAQANFYYGFALKLAPEAPALLKDAAATLLMAGQPAAALPLIERALAAAAGDADHHGKIGTTGHVLEGLALLG